MCCQNLNFDFRFAQTGSFQPKILHFWTKIFRQEEDLPTAQNLGGIVLSCVCVCYVRIFNKINKLIQFLISFRTTKYKILLFD